MTVAFNLLLLVLIMLSECVIFIICMKVLYECPAAVLYCLHLSVGCVLTCDGVCAEVTQGS